MRSPPRESTTINACRRQPDDYRQPAASRQRSPRQSAGLLDSASPCTSSSFAIAWVLHVASSATSSLGARLSAKTQRQTGGQTTPTDSRSQRIRASRRGGQLLTRARSPSNKTGLPDRVCSQMPLSRTVAPYSPAQIPSRHRSDQGSQKASALFHTGYQLHREHVRHHPHHSAQRQALARRGHATALDRRRDDRGAALLHASEGLPRPAEVAR